MEVFENIKIPNAVLVNGVIETDDDHDYEEVVDFLKQYGAINRTEIIKDTESQYHNYLVVEFDSGSAMLSLEKLLPHSHVTKGNTFIVQNLSNLYTKGVGGTKTKSYLDELRTLAQESGKDYNEILKEMMNQIGESIAIPNSPEEPEEKAELKTSPQTPFNPTFVGGARPSPSIAPDDFNPPEIQRYVVEHIVKSEDNAHKVSSQRLRVFSGKVPIPSHEVDYDAWRFSVDLIMKDPAVSDLVRSRKILESLLSPAADMVKHLSPDTLPAVYLQLLDSAFGTVQDGDELYAKFMDTVQDAAEKPSAYLQRLHVALNLTVKRGGIPAAELDKHLLNQFCRGCWDNSLLSELQLKHKKANPPSFSELLLLLRTEEDREAAKAMRMKRHLGTGKQKVSSNWQVAHSDKDDSDEEKGMSATLKALTKQMAAIQTQLAALTANQQSAKGSSSQKPTSTNNKPHTKKPNATAKQPVQSTQSKSSHKPKPGYCFRCGNDGHIKPQCDQHPNPELVAEKRKQFNSKCQKWEEQHQSN